MFLLKLAIRPWKLAPVSQLLASASAVVLLFLIGFLVWFSSSTSGMIKQLSGDQIVTVYLETGEGTAKPGMVKDSIRTSLGSSAVRIDYVGADEFLSALSKNYPELSKEIASLGDEQKALTPQYLSLKGKISQDQLNRIKKISGVESIDTSGDRFRPIVENLQAVRFVTNVFLLASLCALISLFILLARMNQTIHEEVSNLLRQMGSSESKTRLPQILSGVLFGLSTAGVAGFFAMILQDHFLSRFLSFSPYFTTMSPPNIVHHAIIPLAGVGIGAACGWFGARVRSGQSA